MLRRRDVPDIVLGAQTLNESAADVAFAGKIHAVGQFHQNPACRDHRAKSRPLLKFHRPLVRRVPLAQERDEEMGVGKDPLHSSRRLRP